MKFSISSEMLLKALSKVSKVISAKSATYQILDNYLFSFQKGSLRVTASDNYSTLVTTIQADSDFEIDVAIPTKLFHLLRTIDTQTLNIFVNETENLFEISTTSGKYDMPYIKGDMYPEVTTLKSPETFTLDKDFLIEAFNKTLFAVSKNDMNTGTNALLIDFIHEGITIVGTDKMKFSYIKKENVLEEKSGKLLIHHKPASFLLDLLTDAQYDIVVTYDETNVSFHSGGDYLFTKRTEDKFPRYEKILGTHGNIEAILDRKLFLNAIKRSSIFTDTEHYKIEMEFAGDELIIQSKNIENKTSSQEVIPCGFSITKTIEIESAENNQELSHRIVFNGKLLQEVLEHNTFNEISMLFSEANRPAFIFGYEEGQIEKNGGMLLMPIIS